MKTTFILFLLFNVTISPIFSQHIPGNERGNQNYRTNTQIEQNKIRTTVHNFGFMGRTGGEFPINVQTPFEWPKNSGKVYMALNTLLIGAQIETDESDTLYIVDLPTYRNSPTEASWSFEPIPGYYNKEYGQIANSLDKNSWPEFWPDKLSDSLDPGWQGSWDGYLGKDKFINGQEFYYKFSDDNYDKYNYIPDETDLTRKGLGLIISSRTMEFNDIPVEDVVFQIYTIKNDGTKTLNNLSYTFWIGDFVGGNGDSQDDYANYDLENNLVWCADRDNIAPEFHNTPVGVIGMGLVKAPIGFNNISYQPAGAFNFNNVEDQVLWNELMKAGTYFDTGSIIPGEYDLFASGCHFSLEPGEATEIVTAIILANGPIDDPNHEIRINNLKRKFASAKRFFQSKFKTDAFELEITSPINGETITDQNTLPITWKETETSTNNISEIFYSNNNGVSWQFIDEVSPENKTYDWNITNIDDGILNKILIYSYSQNGIASKQTEIFTINNSEKNASPQIFITKPSKDEIISNDYNINWIAGDADGDEYFINLYYETDNNDWIPFASNNTTLNYLWETEKLPNSESVRILGEIISGSDTNKYYTDYFSIENSRTIPSENTTGLQYNTKGTGIFEIHIVDSNAVTGHNYLVEFNKEESNITYNVYDLFNNTKIIDNAYEINGKIEGPIFDGIRLFIDSDDFELAEEESGWNNNDIVPYIFELFSFPGIKGIPQPNDYQIIFGNLGIDTSTSISVSGNTFKSKPVNFKVINKNTNKKINFGFLELDDQGGEGYFTASKLKEDRIIFLEKKPEDSLSYSWTVYLDGMNASQTDIYRLPSNNDSLIINQLKPFQPGDSIIFSTEMLTDISELNFDKMSYKLNQNYPNPFNPTTTIEFYIPKTEFVSLKVFDILGRKVKTLLEKEIKSGTHSIEFNASNLSSGVYLYRIETGNFSKTKKLLLLK